MTRHRDTAEFTTLKEAEAQVDLHCFVFSSGESNWLGSCLKSVFNSSRIAAQAGLSVKMTLVNWGSDEETKNWLSEFLEPEWECAELTGARLSEARNEARRLAKGRFVAFIDGSDMIGQEWLHLAAEATEREPAIYRPEALVWFGPDAFSPNGFEFVLQPEVPPEEAFLAKKNPFPSGFVASREIIEAVPWPCERDDYGWTEVDWWWNCLTSSQGMSQRIVHGAVHYRRTSVCWPTHRTSVERPGPVLRSTAGDR
jgi:hypothetical protein